MSGITSEEDLIATLKLRGVISVEERGQASYIVEFGNPVVEFFIPRAIEKDGYTMEQLKYLEIVLAPFEIELLPIEYNLT